MEGGGTTVGDGWGQVTNDHKWQVKEFAIYPTGQYYETIFTSLHTHKNDNIHMHIREYLKSLFRAQSDLCLVILVTHSGRFALEGTLESFPPWSDTIRFGLLKEPPGAWCGE